MAVLMFYLNAEPSAGRRTLLARPGQPNHNLNKPMFFTLRKFVAALSLTALGAFAWVDKDLAWVESRKNYWAYKKPSQAVVPSIPRGGNGIDAFLDEARRAKGLAASPMAGKEKLYRRLALDLTGLPPNPGELDRFLTDRSVDAYEKAVDRLMASAQYGERWAQRWLDVVRYADTNGYELDLERPHAWRYRDYVVKSFNTGKPYDRFVQEQLAGDELFPGDNEALVATGFHRAGPIHIVGGNQDEEMNRQELLTEMTSTIGAVFMGLSVGCARCHNHKFDPIPQADYYRLQAVLAATEYKDIPIVSAGEKTLYEAEAKAFKERRGVVEKKIKEIEKPYSAAIKAEKKARLAPEFLKALEIPKEKRTKEEERLAKEAGSQIEATWDEVLARVPDAQKAERTLLRKQLHDMDYFAPEVMPSAYAVANMEKAPKSYVLKVGDYKKKLDEVEPAFLMVMGGEQAPREIAGRRSALAKWLTSGEHPLAARVMVNRIWQFRMGTGLVATPNDFGLLGGKPSNQKLLDWLAVEFVARKWDVRAMDKMIVMSLAYRQDTANHAANAKIDSDNKYYWRMNKRRLEGEAIRDSVLAATGVLNPRLGGRPVKIPIEQEIYDIIFTEGEPDNLWPVDRNPAEHNRRTLYLLNKRTVRLPMLANFDQPDAMSSCAMRSTSTHALQALTMMNSDFMGAQAKQFSQRMAGECGADQGCRVRRAYKITLGRAPTAGETRMAADFFAKKGSWDEFALALLNRNEFVYIP